ncbi:hypothetical protein HK098_001708 [Nowakowskiella sp. JEL0407]|nr:hypothetical protein HK098_001708 [Nowakowskiella sp. JEL0407]
MNLETFSAALNANPPRFNAINLAQFPYYSTLDDPEINLGSTYRVFWSLDAPGTRDLYRASVNASKIIRPKSSVFGAVPLTVQNSTVLHFALVLDITKARAFNGYSITPATTSSNVWMGIAFGGTMLDAQFIVANTFDTDQTSIVPRKIFVNERASHDAYGPPTLEQFPGPLGMIPVKAAIEQNFFIAEFRLLTTETPVTSTMLWAFSATPYTNTTTLPPWGQFHGLNKGRQSVKFAGGLASQTPTISLIYNKVHAGGMSLAVILFLIGSAYAKFGKHRSEWLIIHVVCQSLATVLVIGFFVLMFNNLPKHPEKPLGIDDDSTHAIFGMVVIFLLAVQILLGIATSLSLRFEFLSSARKFLRIAHHYFALTFLLLIAIQTFFGVQIMYPFNADPTRGRELWGLFIFAWCIIFFTFVAMEVIYRHKYVNEETFGNKLVGFLWSITSRVNIPILERLRNKLADDDVKKGTFKVLNVPKYKPDNFTNVAMPVADLPVVKSKVEEKSDRAKSKLMEKAMESNIEELKNYTWEDIDECTKKGELLVIANHEYVYTLAPWIQSHPGGQLILYSVAGTDITNDYFMESGFDKKHIEESAKSNASKRSSLRRRLNAGVMEAQTIKEKAEVFGFPSSHDIVQQANKVGTLEKMKDKDPRLKIAGLLDSEVKHLMKARRTHVHTQLAIEKLSTLLVGRIKTPSGASNHSIYEYKRYALVANTLDSVSKSSNIKSADPAGPVYLLKFCMLYPSDIPNPIEFLPGQCVEIQVKLNTKSNSQWISRYFTPLRGTLQCFEILVKEIPGGVVSPFLVNQKPGNRQFRIRGPFGTPVIGPFKPLSPSIRPVIKTSPNLKFPESGLEDKYIFITVGSGLTPALHLVQSLFLAVNVPLVVHTSYAAQNPDEITLSVGDIVTVEQHMFDGWAYGRNTITKTVGVFPLPVTYPPSITMDKSAASSSTTANLKVTGKVPLITIVHGIRYTADAFGLTTLRGAILAYPGTIKLIHAVSQPNLSIEENGASKDPVEADLRIKKALFTVPGEIDEENGILPGTQMVYPRKIDLEMLREVFAISQWEEVQQGGKTGKVYICGQNNFEGMIYEMLVDGEEMVDHNEVIMLPDDRFC